MDLVAYIKLLRRKWQIPALCLLLGATIGWLSMPAEPDEVVVIEGQYYQAAHIMSVAGAGVEGGTNLSNLVFSVKVGQIPDKAAEELDIPRDVLLSQISAQPIGEVGALSLVAVSDEQEDAIQLSNDFARIFMDYTNEQALTRYDARTTALIERRDELRARRDELDLQIETAPASERPFLQEERDAAVREYGAVAEQLNAHIGTGPPGPVLTTLESARATPISEAAFRSAINQNLAAPGTQAQAPANEAEAPASDVASPSSGGGEIGARTRALAGGVMGFAIGFGIVVLLDRFDTRLRSKRETEEAYGLTVVAEVPPLSRARRKRAEVIVLTSPRSRLAEAYRALRTSILFVASSGVELRHGAGAGTRRPARQENLPSTPRPWLRAERGEALTIMVSSPGPEEGKTSTTANLAALMAEAGMQVLVLNCDYRRPQIHKYLEKGKIPNESTLDDEKLQSATGDLAAGGRAVQTIAPGVHLVTGIGEHDVDANPAAVVAAQRRVVEVARRHFDIIVLDTAPLLTTNDAVELLPEADLVVMTARYGKTKRDKAELASELLERLDAPVVGVVFIESPDAPQAQYYYYYLDPAGGRRGRKRDAQPEAGADGGSAAEADGASVTELRSTGGN